MESEQKQASLNKWCETSLVSTYGGRKAGEKKMSFQSFPVPADNCFVH